MPIKIKCPKCQKGLNVPDSLVGKRAACPACKHVLTIPASAPAPAPTTSPEKAPAPAKAAAKPVPRAPRAATAPAKAEEPSPPAPETAPEDLDKLAASLLSDEPKDAPAKASDFVEFTCPMCDEPVKMDASMAGKQAPCPLCKRIVKVPLLVTARKQDWRNAAARPAGARVDQPTLEGAWGSTTDRSIVHGESLEEADAIPFKRDPVTVRQWVARGMTVTAVLVLLVGGFLFVRGWFGGKKQKDLHDKAMAAVSGKSPTMTGPKAGIVYLAAGKYHLRRNERDSARPEKGKGGAWDQFGLARGALAATDGPNAERDALLIELALAQLDMGGAGKAVEERSRVQWDKTIGEVAATVRAIRQPEDKAPPEARVEAVRLLTRKLIELGQPSLAEDLARQVGDGPVSPAVAGVELLRAGKKDAAERLIKQVLAYYPKQSAPVKPPPGEKKKDEPVLPPLTLDIVAFAEAMNQGKELPTPTEEAQKIVKQMGEAVALALSGPAEDMRKKVAALGTAALRLEALVAIADLTAAGEAKAAAEQAASVVKNDLGGQAVSGWVLARLVRVALKSDVDDDSVKDVVGRIRQRDQLGGWPQLQVFRAKLDRAKDKADDNAADVVDPASLAHGLALVELAQHNTRKDKGTIDVVAGWSEEKRPFGYIGAALGLQGEK